MRKTIIHVLLAVSLCISARAQMASGVFGMVSPKLRQFLTDHREASQMMSNVLSEAFSDRTVQLHYFYSEDESVARARHWYPDQSSVIILVRENQPPCDEFIILIFEMLNSEGEKQFLNLFDEAKTGTVTKEDFIRGILRQEFEGYKRTQSFLKMLKISKNELAESYYYNRFLNMASDFEGFLAYSKQVSPKRDPVKEYGPQYDHLRGVESQPNKLPTPGTFHRPSLTLAEVPQIGSELRDLAETKVLEMVNSGTVAPSYDLNVRGIEYVIAVSSDRNEVLFVSTESAQFKTPEGFSITNTLGDILAKYPEEERTERGWGSYVLLPSGWAAFDTLDEVHDPKSKVRFFFRRQGDEKK